MLNFRTRRKKFGLGALLFLLLFGAIFLSVGLFVRNSLKVDPSWPIISGEVVDVSRNDSGDSTTYSPVVRYEVDSESYLVSSGFSSSSYPTMGSSRNVGYNPADPSEATLIEGGMSKIFWLIFFLIGVVCLLLAPILFFRSFTRGRNIKKLIDVGLKIQGVIVDMNSSNGEKGEFKIIVSAVDIQGVVQNYESDTVTGIGSLAMTDFRSNPIAVDVYLDPVDHKNYYVDISDVPDLTPQRIGELIKKAKSSVRTP